MLPYNGVPTAPRQELPTYMLRKDNTVSYKGNCYAVPPGSYKGRGSSVRVLEKDDSLEIYSTETGKLLMRPPLCREKGKLISNTSCRRNPDQRIETLENELREWFSDDPCVRSCLSEVRKAFPRNIRDNYAAISKETGNISSEAMKRAMKLHLEASSPGVNAMLQTARAIDRQNQVKEEKFTYRPLSTPDMNIKDMTPDKTDMNICSIFFN